MAEYEADEPQDATMLTEDGSEGQGQENVIEISDDDEDDEGDEDEGMDADDLTSEEEMEERDEERDAAALAQLQHQVKT